MISRLISFLAGCLSFSDQLLLLSILQFEYSLLRLHIQSDSSCCQPRHSPYPTSPPRSVMAFEKASPSRASVESEDYHFGSLSKLEEQSLLIQANEPRYEFTPPPSPTLPPAQPTAFLDGVRGIAAFLVFLHHFAPNFYFEEHHHGFGQKDPNTNETWHHFASLPFIRIFYTGGDAAVALFFVLSGYVLTVAPLTKIIHMTREGGGTREGWRTVVKSILSAVIRRPIRLYLPAFLVSITYAALRHTVFGPLTAFPELQPSVGAEISSCAHEFVKFFNPFQRHGINRVWFSYGVVVWTIPIELKGSMLVFLLTALYAFASQSRFYRKLYFLQLIALSILLLLLNQWTMSLFVAGMVLALCDILGLHFTSLSIPLPLINRRRHSSSSSKVWIHFTRLLNHIYLIAGFYLLTQPSHKSSVNYSLYTPGWHFLTKLIPKTYLTESGVVNWFDPEYFRFWTSIGGVLTLYALLRITWCQRAFATRVPMYLGKISFALYLTHVTVLIVTEPFVLRITGQWFDGSPMGERWYDDKVYLPEWGYMGLNVRYFGCMAMQLSVCLMVAHIVTILFDWPALRLAHKVAQILRLSNGTKGKPARSDVFIAAPAKREDLYEEKTRGRRLA